MKTIKRITALIVVLSLLCTAMIVPAFAKTDPMFTVTVDKNSVETGDIVTFAISLNHTGGRKLLYTEMYLNYDTDNLVFVQANAIETDTEIDISEVTNITDGSPAVFYELSALDVENGIVITDGIEFFTVQFRVVGTDSWETPQLEVISFLETDMETEIPFDITQAECGVKHICVFNQKVVKDEAIVSGANCNDVAVYFYSCACGAISTTETFTYGTANGHAPSDWQKNETDHWKYCTVCTEEIANSRGNHADTDSNYACDACGYDMTPDHVCEFDQKVTSDDALKSEADCESAAVYYYSCTCGAISDSETFTYGSANGHSESGWNTNSEQHWKICIECRQEIINTRGNHTDNDGNYACDACGYDMTPDHVCEFDQEVTSNDALKSEADCESAAVYYYSCTCGAISDSETFTYGSANGHSESGWKTNSAQHWKICTECRQKITNTRDNHADNDNNYACDACGYDMTPDHICEFDREVTSNDALKSEADCENAAEYYYSCTCGAISDSESFTYGDANGHTESGWRCNSDEHWKICTECREEIKDSSADHEDENDDGECDICDYELEHEDDNRDDDVDDIGSGWNSPFLDIFFVGGSANRAIEYVYDNGLFEGVSRYEFAPNMTMTRGMFVTVLGRMAGINTEVYGGSSFSDVQAGAWYAPGVAWATQNGIVMGYGNGIFGVNDEITVEQAVVILARYADYLGIDTSSDYNLLKFSDRNMVSSWAYAQMQWAVENDIYDGKGKSLVAQKPASRQLVAELIYNFASNYAE